MTDTATVKDTRPRKVFIGVALILTVTILGSVAADRAGTEQVPGVSHFTYTADHGVYECLRARQGLSCHRIGEP